MIIARPSPLVYLESNAANLPIIAPCHSLKTSDGPQASRLDEVVCLVTFGVDASLNLSPDNGTRRFGFQLEGSICAKIASKNSSSEDLGNQDLMSMTLHLRGLSKLISNSSMNIRGSNGLSRKLNSLSKSYLLIRGVMLHFLCIVSRLWLRLLYLSLKQLPNRRGHVIIST